jgi:hypothetical protein
MANDTASYKVYKSRDEIRNQIITLLRQYLELENVDLTKSSFLSFLVEILSTLTSNTLFYQIAAYREFFLTKAQLPESIYNLSAFLGYNPSEASPAEVNVLFEIPFGFEDALTSFTIDEGFEVTAEGGITFTTYYDTTIEVTNNLNVIITVREGNRTYNLPVTKEDSSFYFVLPFRQYSISTQEFQISEDLQTYQFYTIDVPFDGQLSELTVQIRPQGNTAYQTYTEISSLFLMDSSTKGYVKRRTDDGVTLQFGNGLIGYQPEAGAEVLVTLELTNGIDGNVISGSIKSGDRIYNTTNAGVTEIVQYNITNPSPAFNGEDEESIEEIRQNAITNITALERTITENDYVNANVIIDNSPIGQNSLPVLKRSDLKVNEISLYSTIYFGGELVPTRNLFETFTDTYVPRQTVISFEGDDYYTMYDMDIDRLNSSAAYTYIMFEIEQIPTLVTSYGSDYDLYADNLIVSRDGQTAEYRLYYKTTETDYMLSTCEMEISETGATYSMTNDGTSFVYVFPDHSVIPRGELTYFFTIQHATEGFIGQYSANVTFRQSLDDFTMSDAVGTDSTTFTVYDIPTVKKSYYDSINQRDFESQVLQLLLSTLSFKDYRMLTDFVSFKYGSTTGSLQNMQFNETDLPDVQSRLSDPPVLASVGERFIVLNGTGAWQGYDDYIATLSSDSTSWVFTEPKTDEMVYVTDEGLKYLYGENGWVVPSYNIPLEISLDVFREDTYSGSIGDLTQAIREALVDAFSSRFGLEANIYRSEIIDVVQEVDGVDHCRLLKPESSIFFNFDIDNFSQTELLQYGPEYVYFTTDTITIRIF